MRKPKLVVHASNATSITPRISGTPTPKEIGFALEAGEPKKVTITMSTTAPK